MQVQKNRGKRVRAILRRLPQEGPVNCAEVGVLVGALSANLLSHRPDLFLTMVDLWENEKTKTNGLRNIHPYAGRVLILQCASVTAAKLVADRTYDLVHIDADHSYESCRDDIKAWLPKVKPGGWLSGHDFDHPQFPGVRQAVEEYVSSDPRLKLERDQDYTWFVRLPDADN